MMDTEHTQRVADSRKIPMQTVTSKAKKTVLGVGAIALGMAIAVWLIPPLSHWAVYPLLIYGGYCLAGDIMRGLGQWLPALLKDLAVGIRDIYTAVKGNGTRHSQ